MRVTDVLEAGGVVIRPPWKSFEEAVRGLVESLVQKGQIPAALSESAVRAVCQREQMASTAIVEISVRIPHARLEGVRKVVAALAVSPTAVYSGEPEVPITIMALVLSPPDLAADHLQLLSGLSLLLQSETVRRSLRQAADDGVALEVLRRAEAG